MAWPPTGVTDVIVESAYERRLHKVYGLSVPDYVAMVHAQDAACWLCGIHLSDHYGNLHVDHCHITGKIGKILCTNCNGGLGHARDKTQIIGQAINYLKFWHKDSSRWEWIDQPKMRYKRSFWSTGDFKKCSSCREWKEVSTWFKTTNKAARSYKQYRPYCITCNSKEIKNRKLKIPSPKKIYNPFEIYRCQRDNALIQYGLTLEDYNKMLTIQNNSCAICEGTTYRSGRGDLAPDHCHKTGKVRGLLCFHCNLVIGMFKEDIEIMQKAIKYLEEYR